MIRNDRDCARNSSRNRDNDRDEANWRPKHCNSSRDSDRDHDRNESLAATRPRPPPHRDGLTLAAMPLAVRDTLDCHLVCLAFLPHLAFVAMSANVARRSARASLSQPPSLARTAASLRAQSPSTRVSVRRDRSQCHAEQPCRLQKTGNSRRVRGGEKPDTGWRPIRSRWTRKTLDESEAFEEGNGFLAGPETRRQCVRGCPST